MCSPIYSNADYSYYNDMISNVYSSMRISITDSINHSNLNNIESSLQYKPDIKESVEIDMLNEFKIDVEIDRDFIYQSEWDKLDILNKKLKTYGIYKYNQEFIDKYKNRIVPDNVYTDNSYYYNLIGEN